MSTPKSMLSQLPSSPSPGPEDAVFLIGVAGGTASGKTTVCEAIINNLHTHGVTLISQDSFYKVLNEKELQLAEQGDYNFDHPDAFDNDLLIDTLQDLKRGKSVNLPIYNFSKHSREEETKRVDASDVVILEGILVLNDSRIRDLLNLKIYVETDADTRLARRLKRDIAERGRTVDSVLTQYQNNVKPAFEEFCQPSKKYANVIIPWGSGNPEAIDLIVEHVRIKTKQLDLHKIYSNLHSLSSNNFQVRALHTIIRDKNTSRQDFIFYADRLIRLVIEEGLSHLPFSEKTVETQFGHMYCGVQFSANLCGVSIIRSGEAMESALRAVCSNIRIGKLLIDRRGKSSTQDREVLYKKLPVGIANRWVLVMDPMAQSGGSACTAIQTLLDAGVEETRIIFVNLIASRAAVQSICSRFPKIRFVTTAIDHNDPDTGLIVPGLVYDFGDRYFGTEKSHSSQ